MQVVRIGLDLAKYIFEVHGIVRRYLRPLKLVDRGEDVLPHKLTLNVANCEHFIGASGRNDWSIIAISLHKDVGGTPEIKVGDHPAALPDQVS